MAENGQSHIRADGGVYRVSPFQEYLPFRYQFGEFHDQQCDDIDSRIG